MRIKLEIGIRTESDDRVFCGRSSWVDLKVAASKREALAIFIHV